MADLDKLIRAIDAAEEAAYGSDTDETLAEERAAAIDAYLGKNANPAPDGRSQVVDRSVFETIQWILPSLCRIFANGDDVVELPPLGPEDEAAAKQEGAYLNYVLTQRNPWFLIAYEWFWDALATKNAYALVYRDKAVEVEIERYERQTEMGVAALLSDGDVEVLESRAYPDPEGQPQTDPQTGQPVMDPQTGAPVVPMLYDLALRRQRERAKFVVEILPPEKVKVGDKTRDFRLTECDYFEYTEVKTLSQLRAEGFEVADDIAADDEEAQPEDEARDQYGESAWNTSDPPDPASRRVVTRCIWIRHDTNEDGLAELQYVVRVGAEILYREEVSRIPVACIVPNPIPHRHMGQSVADIVKDLQDIKTAILRGGLDSIYQTISPRMAASDKVNLDDLLVTRPGGIVRVDGIPAQELMPLVSPDILPSAMQALEYVDSIRENRTGTNRYFTGIDQNALNKTATGIQQLTTMAAQRVEQIARIFAFGVEDLVSLLHELILKSGHQKEVVKLRGQWVEVDPATWRKRTDFKIAVGYASGNKDAQVNRLMMIAQMQERALSGGLPIVQAQNVYETAIELTKAADLTAPDRFWTNPAQAPPQPEQPDPAVQKAQMDVQRAQMDAQTTLQAKQADVEVQRYKADIDAQTKLTIEQMRIAHEKELAAYAAQKDVTLKQLTAETDRELETHRAALSPERLDAQTRDKESAAATEITAQLLVSQQAQTAQIQAMFAEMMQALAMLAGPKEVVRDKAGRVVGVKPSIQ